jgi:hypothetical protein
MNSRAPKKLTQPLPESISGYVDQVARKERFLEQHPEAVIEVDKSAPPRSRWRGRMPGNQEIIAHELSDLLDRLEKAVGEEG